MPSLALNVFRHAEAQVLREAHGARHVGGDLVEMVEAHELALEMCRS